MESIQTLANESFSYSWLLNVKLPSLDDDASSFIDMDPKMSSSFNFLKRPPSGDYSLDPDFNFNFPKFHPPLPLADADQIFSNGLLLPDLHHRRRLNTMKLEQEVVDEITSRGKLVVSQGGGGLMERWQRSWSKKMVLGKYLGFLRPLYRRLSRKMMSSAQGKVGPTSFSSASAPSSMPTTPRKSTTSAFFFNSDQEETSIYEAVLHCKKSIEKGQVDVLEKKDDI